MPQVESMYSSAETAFRTLGPFAGMYFAARVVISYQKDLLGNLVTANTSLREQLSDQDQRIAHLEDVINNMAKAQLECDKRNLELDLKNSILEQAIINAGIPVPKSIHGGD